MITLGPRASSRPAAAAPRRRIRLALIGASLLAAGFVLLPTFRTVVILLLGREDAGGYPQASQIPQDEWWGASATVIFALIGSGMLLLAQNLVVGALSRAIGLMAAAGYFLAGAGARAMFSFVAANLTRTGADVGAQTAALWAVNIVNGSFIVFASSTAAAWAMMIALHGPRAGIIGRPTSAVLIASALVVVVGLVGIMLPAVQFTLIPIGVALVVSLGRRLRTEPAGA